MEPKLLVKSNINTVVTMFAETSGPQERLLDAFDRMLNCSQKLCVAFGSQVRPCRSIYIQTGFHISTLLVRSGNTASNLTGIGCSVHSVHHARMQHGR